MKVRVWYATVTSQSVRSAHEAFTIIAGSERGLKIKLRRWLEGIYGPSGGDWNAVAERYDALGWELEISNDLIEIETDRHNVH